MPHEIVGNLHMHTPYSDGAAYHAEIAQAAARGSTRVARMLADAEARAK